jgi:hypothetical protein
MGEFSYDTNISYDMNKFFEFLIIRRKTLHHIKSQVKFDRKIPKIERPQAEHIVGGHLKEIDRIIRKLKTVGLEEMIEKEKNSINIILDKKRHQQLNTIQTKDG